MNIRIFACILKIFISVNTFAQIGGGNIYEFLNLPHSARVAALGGKLISIKDNDLNLSFNNPSLLNSSMEKQLVLNYVNYFSDINYGYVSYSISDKKLGNFAAGIYFINYGEFIAADPTGQITGNFKASEYAFNLIWSKPIDSLFTFGVNVKPIFSVFEQYSSFGMAADFGITYCNTEKLFTAALVLKNIGTQISTYYSKNREPLPFEIQFGISQQLEHAPFRFSFLAHHLETFDLTYKNTNEPNPGFDPFTGKAIPEKKLGKFAEKIMRHIIVGVEIIPSENFFVQFGYNYQRKKELQISSRSSTVGFSWGFGFKISKFQFGFGRATYHLAGSSNHFSIITNFSGLLKKQQ